MPSNTDDDDLSTIKVVVRVRPLSNKEVQAKTSVVVDVTRTGVEVVNPALFGDPSFVEALSLGTSVTPTLTPAALAIAKTAGECRTFHFDRCFGGTTIDVDEETQKPNQELIFDEIGSSVIASAFEGFNCTLLAYGQTGSGKTHTMVGDKSIRGKGVIPRLCEALFQEIEARREQETLVLKKTGESGIKRTIYSAHVSYCEIYKEKVSDLLNTNAALEKRRPSFTTQTQISDMENSPRQTLKVREHPVTGPFVEGLSVRSVTSYADIAEEMLAGEKLRTVAATSMNAMSSRSHAIFTITFTQTTFDATSQCANDKTSKISMIDLAGSERANTSGTTGDRLKEGAMINKSLSTLGRVISALSKQAADRIPYRDSTLTWLLKESLGGNAKTTMFAMISPSSANYDETMSTLRYAESAKKVINCAVVNEDKNAQIIRQLRREIEELRAQLATKEGSIEKKQLNAGISASLMERESLYAKLQNEVEFFRTQQKHGTEPSSDLAIHLSDSLPSLVNISANLVPGEALAYVLVEGTTLFGSDPDPNMAQYEAVNVQHDVSDESVAKHDGDNERASDAMKPTKRRGSWSSTMLRRRKSNSRSAPSTPSGQLSHKESKLSLAEVALALYADKRSIMQVCKLPGDEVSRVLPRHARFTCLRAPSDKDSTVTSDETDEYIVELESLDPTAIVLVNGQPLEYGSGRPTKLHHGDQVRLVPGCALLTPRIAEAVEQQPELKLEKDESRELEALVDEANRICTKWVLSTEFAVGSDENKPGTVIVRKKLEADCCSVVHWDRTMLEVKLQFLREFAASLESVTSSPVEEVVKLEDLHIPESSSKDVTPRLPSPLPEIERKPLSVEEKTVDENEESAAEMHLDKPQAHITTSMRLLGYGRIYLAAQLKGTKVPLSIAIYDFSGSFIGKLDAQLESVADAEELLKKRGVFSPKEAFHAGKRVRIQLDKMEFDATSFVAASEISITLKETTQNRRTQVETLETKDMSLDELGPPKIFSTSRVQSSIAATGTMAYLIEETFECATTASKKTLSTQRSAEEESLLVEVWGYDVKLTRCLASRANDLQAVTCSKTITTQQVEFYVSVDVEEREIDGRYHSVAVKPDGSLRLHANRSRRLIVRVTQSDQQPFALTGIVHVRIAAPNAPSVNRTASMSRMMGKTTQRMLPSSRMQSSRTTADPLVGGTNSPVWHIPKFQDVCCVDESSRSLSAILSWERPPDSDIESINSAGSRSTYRLAIAFTTCWSKVPIVVSKSLVAKVCGTSVSATQRFTRGLVASRTVWWAKESFSRSYRLGTWYAADVMVDTLPSIGDDNPSSEMSVTGATRIHEAVNAHISALHRLETAMQLENVRQKVWILMNLRGSECNQGNKEKSMLCEPLNAVKVKLCLDEIFHGVEKEVQVFESGPSNSSQLFLGHSRQPDLLMNLDTGKLVDQVAMTDLQDMSESPVLMDQTPSKLTTHVIHFVSEPTQLVGGDLLGGEMSGFLMLSLDSSLDIETTGAAVAPLDCNTRRPKTPHKSSHRQSWERQWFVLKRPFLYSYQSFARKQQTGVMDLSLCQLSVSTSSEMPFSFRLVCVDGRKQSAVWWLQASTTTEMRAWLVAIDPLKIEARQSVITALTTAVAPALTA